MPRVIQRQITTVKIVSVKLTWVDEADPAGSDLRDEVLLLSGNDETPQAALPPTKKPCPAGRPKPVEKPKDENP